jgi:hypothetical protein
MSVKVLNFPTLQAAWEGINEYMAFNEDEVRANGGGVYGTELVTYSTLVTVDKSWVDPNFDFGKALGYHNKKWTTLVKNYVDFDYLDLVKTEITRRRAKRAKSYNHAYHFANKYGGGKDCLISLVFSKRVSEEFPTVFFNVRTSEATSRLIFDFLLVQRIVEYVYGKDYPVEIHFYAPTMFITAERFSVYASWKGWENIEPHLGTGKFSQRIKKVWEDFTTIDVETIKYKAHKRCADITQRDEDGNSVRNAATMKAKTLKLSKHIQNLPIDIVTQKQINKYIKMKKKEEDENL